MTSPYTRFLLCALPVVLPLMLLGCGGGNNGGPTVTPTISEATSGATAAPNGEAVENNAVVMSAPLPAAATPLISAMKAILKRPEIEGEVLWPYRDSAKAGNITIGVGHLVSSKTKFLQLNLMKGAVAATSAQKSKAWDDLLKAKVGLDASKYKTITNLQISQKDSDAFLTPDVQAHISHVNANVSGFFSLPFAAQIGLTDIDYNVMGGVSKDTFKNLIAAVNSKNWHEAYLQSHRIDKSSPGEKGKNGIGILRNKEIMSLFLAASQNLAISSTNPDISLRTLSLKTSTGGDVSVQPDSIYPTISPKEGRVYTKGVVVNLTAKPDKGVSFDKWQGSLSGSNPEATLTMSDAKNVTATFSKITIYPQNPSVISLSLDGRYEPHVQFSATGGKAPYSWSLNPDGPSMQAGYITPSGGLYHPNFYRANATVTVTDSEGHTGSTTVHVTTQDENFGNFVFIESVDNGDTPIKTLSYSVVGGTLTRNDQPNANYSPGFRLAIPGASAKVTIKNNSKVNGCSGNPFGTGEVYLPPGGSITQVVYPKWAFGIKPTSP